METNETIMSMLEAWLKEMDKAYQTNLENGGAADADHESYIHLMSDTINLIKSQEKDIEKLDNKNKTLKADKTKLNKDIKELKLEIDTLIKSGIRANSIADWINHCNDIKSKAIQELMFNLNEEMGAYSNAGHDLDVYAWLKEYTKGIIGEE